MNVNVLEKKFERTQKKVEILERMMEERTRELFLTNEKLRQTNQYLQSIDDSMVNTLIVINSDDTIKSVNRATLDNFGYSEEELIGQDIGVLFEDESLKWNGIDDLIRRGNSAQKEMIGLTKKGERIPMIFSASVMKNPGGTIHGVLCMALDISVRKKVEEALKREEKKWQNTFDSISDFVSIHDKDFRLVKVNRTLADFLGKRPEELVGKHCYEVFHGTKEPWPSCPHARTIETGKDATEIVDDKNIGCSLLVTTSPIFDDDGDMVGSIHFAKDVTALRKAEENLHLNNARFETLYKLSQMINEPAKVIKDFALEAGVSMTKSKIGYIYFMNEDETELTLHAWSKDVMKECAMVEKLVVYKLEETGLWGEAARQRRPIITNDYETPDPHKKGCPKGHVPIKRHMNIPLIDNGKIVLIAGVGNKEEEYKEEDVKQLTLIMDGMWKIIRKKKTDDELRIKRERLERFQKIVVGREIEMISLKGEINKLHERLGEEHKYEVADRVKTLNKSA